MARPNRIIIYLKAPTRAQRGEKSQRAYINARAFVDPTPPVGEKYFTKKTRGWDIPAHERVCFIISAEGERSTLYVDGLSVNWDGGCRLVPSVLLGDKGENLASDNGVDYGNTNELPVQDLICSFTGAGVLTCTDQRGVTVELDLVKPGGGALCLTVTGKKNGTIGHLVFPHNPKANLTIFQPPAPPTGKAGKRQARMRQ